MAYSPLPTGIPPGKIMVTNDVFLIHAKYLAKSFVGLTTLDPTHNPITRLLPSACFREMGEFTQEG